MIVSINQPAFLPWLGYFHRIAVSDWHVVLDHVQFEKNSFTNRNRIKTPQGAAWLTVPLKTKGRFGRLAIDSLEINDATPWRRKHWQTVQQNYRRAPYFADHAEYFEQVYDRDWSSLSALCRETTGYLLKAFGIDTPLVYSSERGIQGVKSDLVLNLCRGQGATTYLSGPLGRGYLQEGAFREAGIRVLYQDYQHPEYSQPHGPFISHLAAIDLLFNHGPDSRGILLDGQPALDGVG